VMPKAKTKPPVLLSRDAMELEVAAYVQTDLEVVQLQAQIEKEKIAIDAKHQARLTELVTARDLKFAAIHNFCVEHRKAILTEPRKSFELSVATVGFELPGWSVEQVGKENLGDKATRLQSLVLFKRDEKGELVLDAEKKPIIELDCSRYVREAAPALNKQNLLADREQLTPGQLEAMKVKFTNEEGFFIRPKSDVLDG